MAMFKYGSFGKYLQMFLLEYLPKEKNASINTVNSYRDALKLFLIYMNECNNIVPSKVELQDITHGTILKFLDWLENTRGISISSRNHRLAVIHSFLAYVQYYEPECLYEIQKIHSIKSKKSEKHEVDFMNVKNLKILLSQPELNTWKGLREATVLALLYDAALRVQELIELRWSDIKSGDSCQTITIRGKGNKFRTLPISLNTTLLLNEYKTKSSHDDIVFYNSQKISLTRKGVAYILDKNVKKATEISEFTHQDRITCHVLRHSRAAHMVQAGIPLIYIRDFLGHQSVTTTEIYARLNDYTKFEAVNKLSILDSDKVQVQDWNADVELMAWLTSL
jgi:site-specific recombinase XerD